MNDDFVVIDCLVSEFVLQNKALNQCMLDDQHYFSNNDLLSLEQSDLKKTEIQAALIGLMHQFDNHPAFKVTYGDLFVKLSYYAGTLSEPKQTILLEHIQQMREEYTTGLRLVLMNRQIVNTNLGYMKDIISQLTHSPKRVDSTTYDHTGAIE